MRRALALLVLVAIPRVLAFPLTENHYGDAVARIWLAEQWAAAPHSIASLAQGAAQFGPLHLYLLALARWLWNSPEHAGRLVSLLAGIASVFPLEALARRLSSPRGGVISAVGLAFWGLHIQCSTTAASEALNLLLIVGCVALLAGWLEGPRASHAGWLGAALLLNLACATRYDSWALVPMLGAAVWWRTRRVSLALLFSGSASAFAIPWMFGTWADSGSPLAPFVLIDDYHRAWFPSEAQTWGGWYPLLTTFFWPGVALLTLTPPVALVGGCGLWFAWRERPAWRWLVVLALVPPLAFAVRAGVFHSFVPLARFAVKEMALLLVFAGFGADRLLAVWPRAVGRRLLMAAGALLMAWVVGLGWFCHRREGRWEDTLRPVSPTTTNSHAVWAAARWLRANLAGSEAVLIADTDPRGHDDLQVSFFSGLPYERGARYRAATFESRLRGGPWGALLLFDGGSLHAERLPDGSVLFRGVAFEEVELGVQRLRLYRRRGPSLSQPDGRPERRGILAE